MLLNKSLFLLLNFLFLKVVCFKITDNYIYGNQFKKLCNHIFEIENKSFDPYSVKKGDLVFVLNRFEILKKFFLELHPKIKNKYILVTHNDDCFPIQFKKYLDDNNIYAWFGVNVNFEHIKLIPIPIGIAEKCFKSPYIRIFNKLNNKKTENKKYILYMNFDIWTNPKKRLGVFKLFYDKAFCFHCPKSIFVPQFRKSPTEFLEDVQNSLFVLSPEGNGLDCYRTWESLYLNSIPIIKSLTLNNIYKYLPVLIVNDWSEITDDFLYLNYIKIKKNKDYKLERLYFNYWQNLIMEYQRNCRSL